MFKKILSSELGKGAFILLITMNIFWFFNLLFHFFMGRLLGPENYSTLAVLMSIIYLYGVPSEAIQNIISNYVSKFNFKKENGKIKFLMLKSLKKGFKISIILFIILSILSIFLSIFLKINLWLMLFANILIFSSFSLPVVRGVLQGRKKFNLLGIGMVVEAMLKLIAAVFLVYLGFGVFGALWGIIFGILMGFIVSLEFNRQILNSDEKKIDFKNIHLESIPYFIAMFIVIIVLSSDIILAKVFFSSKIAGQYAALSMLGKVVFFGTMAISKTMFPLTSEKNYKKENTFNLFKKSFLIVSFLCFVAIFIYAVFPQLIINLLYGKQYLELSKFLVYPVISFSFLSLTNLILIYSLSTNGLKKPYYLLIFVVIETLLLFLFHSTIFEYIIAFMVSNAIMFIGTLFLLLKWRK